MSKYSNYLSVWNVVNENSLKYQCVILSFFSPFLSIENISEIVLICLNASRKSIFELQKIKAVYLFSRTLDAESSNVDR